MTPRKVNDRLIRLLFLLLKRHFTLDAFEQLLADADKGGEIDENLRKFLREKALYLTEKGTDFPDPR
jgi:hypothetical protein